MPRYNARRRGRGYDDERDDRPRYRTIVRIVEVAPLAESTPELQWLTDGIVRRELHLRLEEHPHNIAMDIIQGMDRGIPYSAALRWLHAQPADNEFAQSLKRWFRANGELTPRQIECCRDRDPSEIRGRGRRGGGMQVADLPATLPPVASIPAMPPAPPPAPVPAQAWVRSTIEAMWGDQAPTIIAELRGNGISVIDD